MDIWDEDTILYKLFIESLLISFVRFLAPYMGLLMTKQIIVNFPCGPLPGVLSTKSQNVAFIVLSIVKYCTEVNFPVTIIFHIQSMKHFRYMSSSECK